MGEPLKPVIASTQQLLDAAADGVLIIDADARIRLVNRHAAAMFGYDRDELLGQPTELLVPDRNKPDLAGDRAEYYRNPTIGSGLDIAVRRKDGTEFPVDVSFTLLETDDGLFVHAAVRDSSERKAIEARSQSFDAISHMAAIVESSDDAIIGKRLDGVITSWNEGAEHMYGYAPDEIIGHNVSELMPPDRVGELAPILGRVQQGERVEHFESQRVRRDGTLFDVSVTVSPIRDAYGTVTGASSMARDLTEAKRAETARRELGDRLRRSERLESMGQLAGGVAHDFNNLLAGIMNYAGLVATCLQEELAHRGLSDDDAFMSVVQDAEEITKVARRAATLTRQLLIFSRREIMQPEALDLNSIITDMEKLLRSTIGENVDLRTVLAPDLPLIKADRGQIDQVIMNLAVNARDAMPSELEIETATFEADERYARDAEINPGTYVRLTVSDTGTGMSKGVKDRMFEPFFTTKPKGEGTGLGLATVYGIVTQAGGDVTIYSELGLGTAVRVNLPATSDSQSGHRDVKAEISLSAKGETVLLVEDEEIVREPTRRTLVRNGYTVLSAGNADEALTIVREHPGTIDLLLTDVVMPGRSGKALSVAVVELSPTTKVLFMSGYSQDVIVHQGVLEEGANLVEKPFAADDLLRRIRDVLDGGS